MNAKRRSSLRWKIVLVVGLLLLAPFIGYQARVLDEHNQYRSILNALGLPGFGPSGEEEPFEESLLSRRNADRPDLDYTLNADFLTTLQDASGYALPRLVRTGIRPGRFEEWRTLGIRELFGVYTAPSVELTALFRTADNGNARNLVVLLHGLRSTAAKAIGVDGLDYMSEVGTVLVRDGYDVIAPELPSSPIMASAIQTRLLMRDRSALGLFPRFTCDLIEYLDTRNQYERIIVYGIRYGGRLAEVVAQLCDQPIERVIVDGVAQPWRWAIQDAALQSRVQSPALFQHRRPLLANSSFLDFMAQPTAAPLLYLLDRESLGRIEPLLDEYFQRGDAASESAVVIARRAIDHPFVNMEEFSGLIAGELGETDAFSIVPN